MVVTCEISFNQNAFGTYFAGQMVSGSVIITSDKTKIVKGLALKIKGCARTRWTERHGTGKDRRSHTYFGEEDYIASTTYLLGSEESQTVQIEPGTHTYTFACALPVHCPSSFEGKQGYIRYVVKVVFYRPWKFDQTFTRGFTVLQMLDLNFQSPVLRVPATQEISKTFCCGPCSSKPVTLSVSVPQTGFVPGQAINVTVGVTNGSNVQVMDVKISFVMVAILYSQRPRVHSHLERTNLTKIKAGPVNSQSSRTITEAIRVPAAPPSCTLLCRILQVSYQLEVELKLKGMHQNPIISIPLMIGNVPLVSVIQQQPMPFSSEFQTAEPSAPKLEDVPLGEKEVFTVSNGSILPVIDPVQNPSDPLSSADLNLPPPTYEEAIFMTRADCNEEDQHPLGKSDFVPRYPVYSIPEACAPPPDEFVLNTDPNKSTWL